jgi:hypothetical protein
MTKDSPKCPNGHPANSDGACFDQNCVYRHQASTTSDANRNQGR